MTKCYPKIGVETPNLILDDIYAQTFDRSILQEDSHIFINETKPDAFDHYLQSLKMPIANKD